MCDYLRPKMDRELQEISVLGLAHIGDAVLELMVRTWLCERGTTTAKLLHSGAVAVVSAKAQAATAKLVVPELHEDELAVFKRGRNTHVHSIPRGSSFEEYHLATAIEALMGFLYLSGKTERLNWLFELIVGPHERVEC